MAITNMKNFDFFTVLMASSLNAVLLDEPKLRGSSPNPKSSIPRLRLPRHQRHPHRRRTRVRQAKKIEEGAFFFRPSSIF